MRTSMRRHCLSLDLLLASSERNRVDLWDHHRVGASTLLQPRPELVGAAIKGIGEHPALFVAQRLHDILPEVVSRTASASHLAEFKSLWTPCGSLSPMASASCQPFLRSTRPSKPSR